MTDPIPAVPAGLLPCPFCGGRADMVQPGTRRHSCIVDCLNCGCRLESGDEGERSGESWNRRAVPAGSADLRELLQEAEVLIDSMASWFRSQPLGAPPAGTAQWQAKAKKALAAAPSLSADARDAQRFRELANAIKAVQTASSPEAGREAWARVDAAMKEQPQ